MQLDADDDDQPFFKPSVVQTEPLTPKSRPGEQPLPPAEQRAGDTGEVRHEEAALAAAATVEQEE